MTVERIPMALALIADLAERRGVRSINALPGCWEVTVGDWSIAVNGHREETRSSAGDAVPPFHALCINTLAFGDMLMLSPGDGIGTEGSEGRLIEAIEAALREEH